jgi:hypothetical protein
MAQKALSLNENVPDLKRPVLELVKTVAQVLQLSEKKGRDLWDSSQHYQGIMEHYDTVEDRRQMSYAMLTFINFNLAAMNLPQHTGDAKPASEDDDDATGPRLR